jgi:hypothetical protein
LTGKNATINLASVTLANGFALTNNGAFTWSGNWNQNNAVTVNNTACGTMVFSQGTTLQNNAVINNSGTLIFQQSLTTNSGTTIDNRGKLIVVGDFTPSGKLNNQWQAVFKGTTNNFNTGDSIINLYTLVFKNAITGTIKMRNDGLFWVGGSFQYNSGASIKMNRTNAQIRVSGAFVNNSTITGNGKVFVTGSFANNGALTGKSAAEKLSLNQNITSGTTNTQYNSSMFAEDTTTFVGGAGNPDVSCAVLLPMVVTTFRGNYLDNAVNLSWATATEANGKKFVIEYSTDGIAFTKAGEVAAKGNTTTQTTYQYRYTGVISASMYFRLVLEDLDGAMEYAGLVNVKTGAVQKVTASAYPNPFAEKLEVLVSSARSTTVTIKLMDMNGRTVKIQVATAQAGNNKYQVTGLSNLNKGMYMLEVTAGEEKWIQKLIR